jgi:hypothetical protein
LKVPALDVDGTGAVVEPTPPVAAAYQYNVFPPIVVAFNAAAIAPWQYVRLATPGAATEKNLGLVNVAPLAATEPAFKRASGVTPSGVNKLTQLI